MKKTSTATPQATVPVAPAPAPSAASEHLRNPVLAKALFAIMAGDPAVVIDSPPGAGKTHLITHLAHQLHTRGGMTVAIAGQTRAQSIDVANRTAATGVATILHGDSDTKRPHGLDPAVGIASASKLGIGSGVIVATTARWLWMPPFSRSHFDVLLIDEAYQLTFADLAALGSMADQFVLVGDPGQIAPVVTGSTRRWNDSVAGPHRPAPEALIAAHGDDVTRLRLPQTWRLGPATTDLLAPLYTNLPFTSARPPRHIELGGAVLPEYQANALSITAGVADPIVAQTISRTVRELIGGGRIVTTDSRKPLTAADVAVVTPHVEQAALASAALADLPDVFVGTINQGQGLQREAVVAVHPLLGHDPSETFALDLGRLCVALSRHQAHVRVLTDQRTASTLSEALIEHPNSRALQVHASILAALG